MRASEGVRKGAGKKQSVGCYSLIYVTASMMVLFLVLYYQGAFVASRESESRSRKQGVSQ